MNSSVLCDESHVFRFMSRFPPDRKCLIILTKNNCFTYSCCLYLFYTPHLSQNWIPNFQVFANRFRKYLSPIYSVSLFQLTANLCLKKMLMYSVLKFNPKTGEITCLEVRKKKFHFTQNIIDLRKSQGIIYVYTVFLNKKTFRHRSQNLSERAIAF